MRKTMKLMCGLLIVSGGTLVCKSENVLLTSPAGFELLSVSSNGKWACGAYRDAGNSFYGFRWNLESGKIDVLGEEPSLAYDIADDGTVSGEFYDKSLYSNGAGRTMPGYWRNGAWHSVEIPEGGKITDDGIGYGISANGQYMTGSLPINGVYTPFIWKEGRIHRRLPSIEGKSGVGFAVSPDGNRATGFIEKENRTACYWDADGNIRYFEECEGYSSSPWHYGRKFSPDGTKVLFWGGLEMREELGTAVVYCLYDINTDQVTYIPGNDVNSDLEFNGISDDNTLVGSQYGRGFIWQGTDGGSFIDDYLDAKNVDFGDIFYDFYQDFDYLPITNCIGISADSKVLGMRYINKDLETVSLIVKLDQDLTEVSPVDVSVEQMSGLRTVAMSWKCPVGATVKGYHIYRDGQKISGFMPIKHLYFYDKNVEEGNHVYEISAVNLNGTEKKCDPISIEVNNGYVNAAPYNLTARQKGINRASIEWEEPMSRCIHKNYASPTDSGLTALNIYAGMEVENAIRVSKEELANYAGCKITEVSFRPMGANPAWVVNLYSYDEENSTLTLLQETEIEEELTPDNTYTLHFENPVDLPVDDLIVGVLTLIPDGGGRALAGVSGKAKPGYSDLMRSPDDFDEDFFSATERAAESGMYSYYSWAIDLGLSAVDGSTTSVSPEGYNLYIDEEEPISTENAYYLTDNLADGIHRIGVETCYDDGSKSGRIETSVQIATKYPGVRNVTVNKVEGSDTKISAEWDNPVDEDLSDISYTVAENYSMGVKATENTEYEYMAAALYPSNMLKDYTGYEIRSVRFMPLTEAEYTVMVAEGETILTGLSVTEINKGVWNEVDLPEAINILPGKDYMLAIYVGTPTPDTDALCIDDVPPLEYYSDLISLTGGQSWMSLGADAGAGGSWMMGIRIADPVAEEIEADGYDVVIDNRKRNESPVTENSFEYDMVNYNTRRHSIHIDAHYPGIENEVKGKVTYFRLETSGINETAEKTIRLVKGANSLVAEGDDVKDITVYDMTGMICAHAEGNMVRIDALVCGVYIVEVKMGDRTRPFKINITR